jgi:hypothetical protein
MREPKLETVEEIRQPVVLRDLSQPVELLSEEQAEQVQGGEYLRWTVKPVFISSYQL